MTVVLVVAVLGSAVAAISASPVLRAAVDRLRVEPIPPVAGSATPHRVLALRWPGIVVGLGVLIAGLLAPTLAAFALLVIGIVLLVVVSMVDMDEHRIPNLVTYPVIGGCLATVAIAAVTTGFEGRAVSAVVGAVTFASILLTLHLLRPDAMGLGDVKLVFSLGFAIGWVVGDAAVAPAAVGFTLIGASIFGIAGAIRLHRVTGAPLRGRSLPFGPPLSIAASLTIAVSLGLS